MTLQDVLNYSAVLGGILCVGAFLYCLVKLITDGDNAPNYTRKIKNILIALILITLVPTIINTTQSYFSLGNIGIGKIPEGVQREIIDGAVGKYEKDMDGREIVYIDGIKCLVYQRECALWYKWENDQIAFHADTNIRNQRNALDLLNDGYKQSGYTVDVIKKFSECQNLLHGSKADDYAYRIHEGWFDNNVGLDKEPSQYAAMQDNGKWSINAGHNIIWMTNNGHLVIDHGGYFND